VQEIAAGIHHWSAFHEGIRLQVSSYYIAPARTLIDPMVPDEGLEVFEALGPPEQILLTNRHHYRHSDRFAQRFGCVVRASAPGLHEFEGTPREVQGFEFGERLAEQITAVEIDAICPDETALHIELGDGAVALADGLVRGGDRPLRFVSDALIGDDPEAVKRGLREAYARLAERDFEYVLLAHGEPIAGGGRQAVLDFVRRR
jgi:hypothetical protein